MAKMIVEVNMVDGELKNARFEHYTRSVKNRLFIEEEEELVCMKAGNLTSRLFTNGKERAINEESWFKMQQTDENQWEAIVYTKVSDDVRINFHIVIRPNDYGSSFINCYASSKDGDDYKRTNIACYDDCEEDYNNLEVIVNELDSNDESDDE